MTLCEVRDLRTEIKLRHGRVRPVDGVSFSIEAGETLGLVGESGSGKTMTGLSILRLLPPGGRIVAGSVSIDGQDLVLADVASLRSVRGGQVGMIFQDPMTALDPTMTIGKQVSEVWRLHKKGSSGEARAAALEVLDLVGIPRPAERYGSFPHQLSGGLRQRVMIAAALVCRPKLLIADEPTTALDVTIQAQILALIADLKTRLGMAVLLITHDMGVVANNADRVAVMYAGEIVESGPTSELFTRTRHRYSQALLDSIPRLSQDRNQRLRTIAGLPPNLALPLNGCRFAPRCAHADELCRVEQPSLAGDVHSFACFHPVPKALNASAVSARTGDRPKPVATAPILSCEQVTKDYTTGSALSRGRTPVVRAVSEVSFEIGSGETFGLVGESGCGKTTLGHLAVGLETPTAGLVRYAGEDTAGLRGRRLKAVRSDMQLMFQDPYSSLNPRMKVEAIIAEPLVCQRVGDRRERSERVGELLSQVGLRAEARNRYPHEFSGGQRQRIGLARALALNPKLVVADEPVSALDVSIRSQILNLMRDLQQAHGLTYLIISHDLSVVRYMADRIGVMYLGKLVEIGPAEELYERPAHPYTSGLLAAIPDPEPAQATPGALAAVRGELPSAADPPSGCRYRTRCPLAQEICAAAEPPLDASVSGIDHSVACHFPLQPPLSPRSSLLTDRSRP